MQKKQERCPYYKDENITIFCFAPAKRKGTKNKKCVDLKETDTKNWQKDPKFKPVSF